MADTQAGAGLRKQIWEDKFFTEYMTENRFTESMGSDENAVIQVKESLGKGRGDSVSIALVNKLDQAAVLGSNMMEGAEEDMTSRSQRIYIDKRRNAVRIPEMEEIKSAIELRDAARAVLKDWAMKDLEQQIIEALLSINGVKYSTSNETQRDEWLVDNKDRALFGATLSNSAAGDHSAARDAIDNTADKFTPASIDLMKELAVTANPKIPPVRVEKSKGRRYYVIYANSRAMRDLRGNAAMQQAQREVALETENNRLFEGGDLLWNGVIVKEVPDIPFYTNAGSVGISPVFMCGAQSVAVAYGKRWHTITKTFDYGDKYGIAIEGIMGTSKLTFGTGATDTADLKDNGIITGWFAAVAST